VQITNGTRPYGSIAPASLDLEYPFLQSAAIRRNHSVLLNYFECEDYYSDDTQPLPNLSYCDVSGP
jgi:hypothetical protein